MQSRLFCCGRKKPKNEISETSPLIVPTEPKEESGNTAWTFLIVAGIFGEFLTLPLATAELIKLYESLSGDDSKDWLGFSRASVLFAAPISLFLLVTSAYMHYVLNKNHLDKNVTQAYKKSTTFWQKVKDTSHGQRTAVAGHTLDHALAIAAAILFAAEFFTEKTGNSIPRTLKIVTQALGLAVGIVCTLADTGTDLEALSIRNANEQAREAAKDDAEKGLRV